MALAYARSRHYYVPDDLQNPAPWHGTTTRAWRRLTAVDTGGPRSAATSTASRVSSTSCGRLPRRPSIAPTTTRCGSSPSCAAVMSHLTTDQNLTLGELKSLVHTFRRLKPADVEMTTLPWSPDPSNGNRARRRLLAGERAALPARELHRHEALPAAAREPAHGTRVGGGPRRAAATLRCSTCRGAPRSDVHVRGTTPHANASSRWTRRVAVERRRGTRRSSSCTRHDGVFAAFPRRTLARRRMRHRDGTPTGTTG